MSIESTEDLADGSLEIDNQHSVLFKMIHQMFEPSTQGKGKDVLNEIIGFLERYVVTHFSTEENLMKRYDYPDYLNHKNTMNSSLRVLWNLRTSWRLPGLGLIS